MNIDRDLLILQKGAALHRRQPPEGWRSAIRIASRKAGQRVRTGVTSWDGSAWAFWPDWKDERSEDERMAADRELINRMSPPRKPA